MQAKRRPAEPKGKSSKGTRDRTRSKSPTFAAEHDSRTEIRRDRGIPIDMEMTRRYCDAKDGVLFADDFDDFALMPGLVEHYYRTTFALPFSTEPSSPRRNRRSTG